MSIVAIVSMMEIDNWKCWHLEDSTVLNQKLKGLFNISERQIRQQHNDTVYTLHLEVCCQMSKGTLVEVTFLPHYFPCLTFVDPNTYVSCFIDMTCSCDLLIVYKLNL